MASFQASNALLSSSPSCSTSYQRQRAVCATLHLPKKPIRAQITLPKLPRKNLVEQLSTTMNKGLSYTNPITAIKSDEEAEDSSTSSTLMAKLCMIEQMVSDRVEMHKNIGEQRNNWNNLLNSINAITLTATAMAGFASVGGLLHFKSDTVLGVVTKMSIWCSVGGSLSALNLSSSLLFTSATGMLLIMNKIQPSQLAEEQRNAERLFKQLQGEIKTMLAIGNFTSLDINAVVDKVLALDKAFPLPLLGGVMIEKFPEVVEPSRWWPRRRHVAREMPSGVNGMNGWTNALEEEMKEIVKVMKIKDTEEYMKLSKLILNINKVLAISGPILTGVAAIGSAFTGSHHGAAAIGIAAGALASVVNTLEHGGQIGMVFEMYRNCGGYFKLLEETIESTLNERDTGRRENGELFEMKVALQLGRSLEELRELASKSCSCGEGEENTMEFASKLF